jgi:hypothetical protein
MGDYTDRSSPAEMDEDAVLSGNFVMPSHMVGEAPQLSDRPMSHIAEMEAAMAADDDNAPVEKRVKTGGRQKGTPNKVARVDLRKVAHVFTLRAVSTLVEIMENPLANNSDRISAAKEILDRAHGKAKQITEIGGIDGGDIQTKLTIEFVGQPPVRANVEAQITDKAGEIIDVELETVRVPEKRRPWDIA